MAHLASVTPVPATEGELWPFKRKPSSILVK